MDGWLESRGEREHARKGEDATSGVVSCLGNAKTLFWSRSERWPGDGVSAEYGLTTAGDHFTTQAQFWSRMT